MVAFLSAKTVVYCMDRVVNFFPNHRPPLSRLQEKHTREKLRDHLKMITGLQSELAEVQGRVAEARRNIQEAHERQKRMLAMATR